MRTILVALAVTIGDDDPTPSGAWGLAFGNYAEKYVSDWGVLAIADREHPENNVEEQLFTDYAPRSNCCSDGAVEDWLRFLEAQ